MDRLLPTVAKAELPVSVTSPPERRVDARPRSQAADAPQTRRAARHGSIAHQRRMVRLRRSVLVAVTALLFGTVVARVTQDPAVALPRPPIAPTARSAPAEPNAGSATVSPGSAAGAAPASGGSATAATGVPTTSAPDPSSRTATSAAAPSTGSPADAEEGVAEPVAPAGATLAAVPQSAAGTLHPVAMPDLPAHPAGRVVRVAVEIEDGLSLPEGQFSATVARVLADTRGWQTSDGVRFVVVSPAELAAGARTDIRVALATPTLTAKLCAPLDTTTAQVSCWNGSRAVLNLQRWLRGSATYGSDLESYRTYLVNHEVGHGLGHRHAQCPTAGAPAPIMVQQTKSLEGCTAWPWPTRP